MSKIGTLSLIRSDNVEELKSERIFTTMKLELGPLIIIY
jgi:hypothetical protein